MGQIITTNAKPKRCNLQAIQNGGSHANDVLANGEIMLVAADNSMNSSGVGIFDSYVVGDGTTAASGLNVISLVDEAPTYGSKNGVSSDAVYKMWKGFSPEITDYPVKNYQLKDDYTTFGTDSGYKHGALAVSEGEQYFLENYDETRDNVRWAFATTDAVSSGGTIPMVSGTTVSVVNHNSSLLLTIPSGCSYLLFNCPSSTASKSYNSRVYKVDAALARDNVPTSGSVNLVTSGGTYTAIQNKTEADMSELPLESVAITDGKFSPTTKMENVLVSSPSNVPTVSTNTTAGATTYSAWKKVAPNATYIVTSIDYTRFYVGYTIGMPKIGSLLYSSTKQAAGTVIIPDNVGDDVYLFCYYYSSASSLDTEANIFAGLKINGTQLNSIDFKARGDIAEINTDITETIDKVDAATEDTEVTVTPDRDTFVKLPYYFDHTASTTIKNNESVTTSMVCIPAVVNTTYTVSTIDSNKFWLGLCKVDEPELGSAIYNANNYGSSTLSITTTADTKWVCVYYFGSSSTHTESEIYAALTVTYQHGTFTAVDKVAREAIDSIISTSNPDPFENGFPINALDYHAQWDSLVALPSGAVRRSDPTYLSYDTNHDYPLYVYRIQMHRDWMGRANGNNYKTGRNSDWTNPLYARKKIMIISGVHGNERLSPNALVQFVKDNLNNPGTSNLFADFDFVIVPLVNPYGYSHTMLDSDSNPVLDNQHYSGGAVASGYSIIENTSTASIGLRMTPVGDLYKNINRDFVDSGSLNGATNFVTAEAQFVRDLFISEQPDLAIDMHQDFNDSNSGACGFAAPGLADNTSMTSAQYTEITRKLYIEIDKAGCTIDAFVNKYLGKTEKQLTYSWVLNAPDTPVSERLNGTFKDYASGGSGNTLHTDVAADYSVICETDIYCTKIGGGPVAVSKLNGRAARIYGYAAFTEFLKTIPNVLRG